MVSFSLVKALLIALAINHVQAIAIPSTSNSIEVAKDNLLGREAHADSIAPSKLNNIYDRSSPGQSPNPAEESKRGLQKRTNTCGVSSFVNMTSSNSPTSGDCNLLRDQQTRFPQQYTVNKSTSWKTVVWFGTCAFAVKTTANYPAALGNEDIADVMRDSLAKFTSGGRIGAEGSMPCRSTSSP